MSLLAREGPEYDEDNNCLNKVATQDWVLTQIQQAQAQIQIQRTMDTCRLLGELSCVYCKDLNECYESPSKNYCGDDCL